ncbi:MAG: hypothetical protein ACRCR1_04065 [Aeromonas sp.]
MLGVSFWMVQVGADELWLVELEHNDGMRLQFQGVEAELGNATVWRQGKAWVQPLKPGERLALLVADGVATRIELLGASLPFRDTNWQRAEDRLQSVNEQQLTLATLGSMQLNPEVHWVNGSAADLHPGSELVLTRSMDGMLRKIEVVNPEE